MNSMCWCCHECLTIKDSAERSTSNGDDDYDFDVSHPLFHVTKVLQYHPSYLQSFLDTYNFVLHQIGPLPVCHRLYIGIMAVSRYPCSYLLNQLTSEFLSSRGNEKWLQGLDEAPEKLRNLDELNKLLAHRPWLIEPSHILKLTKGGRELWTMSELTQAIVILVLHHSLVSLLASCGIAIDDASGSSPGNAEAGNSQLQHPFALHRQTSEVYGIDVLLERMKLVKGDASEEFTPEERLARFKDIERQSVDLLNSKKKRKKSTEGRSEVPVFTHDLEFGHEDFATEMIKMVGLQPFPIQDYSWGMHGYVVASTYYGDSAPFLDNNFRVAKDLTYNMVGTYPNVDTTTFRTAIWNYTQCMLGIMHDDYNYEVVNTLLEKNLRSYIKSVTCFPETVTKAAYEGFMKDLLPSEKVHINIMIHEARFQAELLFGFRAVSNYMSQDW